MDYVVTISENLLKISFINKELQIKTLSKELDSLNLDAKSVSSQIVSLIGKPSKDISIVFLLEPQDVLLRFVTVKKSLDSAEQIMISIKAVCEEEAVKIEDLYFSYKKLAPFVFQFASIKQEKLNYFLEMASFSGFEIKAIIPWIMLLPRIVSAAGEPCIFVSLASGNQTVVLSELSGVYFSNVFQVQKSNDELLDLVKKLSIYERSKPIDKIYTLNADQFSIDPNYQVMSLPIDSKGLEGFELHLLFYSSLQKKPDLLTTQPNFLNMLPLPVKQESKALVLVGGIFGAILVVSAVVGFVYLGSKKADVKLAQGSKDSVVLSEKTGESTKSADKKETKIDEKKLVEKPLVKKDLKIRIENGAGVSGVAASAKVFLEKLGYTVVGIDNAKETGRENTLVKFKTAKLEYKDMLVSDVKDKYSLVVEDGLADSLEYDVLIVIGLK